ncbi:hypothetical protein M378DRAFT_171915 [Amanita muscaria Koide BX008]|uniref:Uncharacterized protein n=1 Tax=Amanita muscaria (strain Koide BX008) TaxID=946122 RepID=A0A0C2W822_AMAMK|nr:hypothetical protein M378DRAFT_171915 [Amanita muscaria Koide BX008]
MTHRRLAVAYPAFELWSLKSYTDSEETPAASPFSFNPSVICYQTGHINWNEWKRCLEATGPKIKELQSATVVLEFLCP